MTDDFADWYHAQWRRVVATLRLVTGEADLAEDAVAEAFTRAWARWPAVRRCDDPTAWVYRVAVNEVRSRQRRRAPEGRALTRLAAGQPLQVPPPELPEGGLWRAVAELPERMRTATALRYVADLPEAEIAEIMGVSRGTVASTLHDARRRLAGAAAASRETS